METHGSYKTHLSGGSLGLLATSQVAEQTARLSLQHFMVGPIPCEFHLCRSSTQRQKDLDHLLSFWVFWVFIAGGSSPHHTFLLATWRFGAIATSKEWAMFVMVQLRSDKKMPQHYHSKVIQSDLSWGSLRPLKGQLTIPTRSQRIARSSFFTCGIFCSAFHPDTVPKNGSFRPYCSWRPCVPSSASCCPGAKVVSKGLQASWCCPTGCLNALTVIIPIM